MMDIVKELTETVHTLTEENERLRKELEEISLNN